MARTNGAGATIFKQFQAGCCYTAPYGTALPTAAKIADFINAADDAAAATAATALVEGFTYVSDISDAGVVGSVSTETTNFSNMDGEVKLTVNSSRDETLKMTFIDRVDAARGEMYGYSNVVNDATNGIVATHHNNEDFGKRTAIMLFTTVDGYAVRVVPCYTRTELGDETLLVSNLWGREVTWACQAVTNTLTGTKTDTIIDFAKADVEG